MDLQPQLQPPAKVRLSTIDAGLAAAVAYHNLFDYPLRKEELSRWFFAGEAAGMVTPDMIIASRDGFYYLAGREDLVVKRLFREKISQSKLSLARRAATIIQKTPTVKMVAVTGSLAMGNARDDSDIDLMIVTQAGTLWLTRFLVYLALRLGRFSLRSPGSKEEENKLCLNIWLDETELFWTKQNIFTAHEIAQIIPLVNKDKTYERFLYENGWVANYWPNAASKWQVSSIKDKQSQTRAGARIQLSSGNILLKLTEKIAFGLQYLYMKPKITCEVISPTRALFHPIDWSEEILTRFGLTP